MPHGYEWADVLIVVKTYPAPSTRHGETVCIAGVRLDSPTPTWIRLYPISFRALESDDQFKKYQVVRVPVRSRGSSDPRPESYSPHMQGLQPGAWFDTKQNWQARKDLIGPLIGATTTCELIRMNKAGSMDQSIPSLGMVQAHRVQVDVEEGKPWTQAQLAKVRQFSAADLLNPDGHPELQPVPYTVRINYYCADEGCPGHKPSLIDWELGVAGLTWPRRYGKETATMIRGHYAKMLDSTHDVHLIIGNQHQRRQTFSVCGVWSPKLT